MKMQCLVGQVRSSSPQNVRMSTLRILVVIWYSLSFTDSLIARNIVENNNDFSVVGDIMCCLKVFINLSCEVIGRQGKKAPYNFVYYKINNYVYCATCTFIK